MANGGPTDPGIVEPRHNHYPVDGGECPACEAAADEEIQAALDMLEERGVLRIEETSNVVYDVAASPTTRFGVRIARYVSNGWEV